MRSVCALLLWGAGLAAAEDVLLFSFFRGNGESGLHLAASADGLTWRALNNDKPLLEPKVGESKLMRDPSIARGPDGVFHMVWTTSWQGKTIGYTNSRDLVHWSEQRAIEPFADSTGVANCWAPELFYDAAAKEWWIVWASTIKGKFRETLGSGNRENNHRQYAVRTRDFVTFTAAELFYDPGFLVIDAALFRDGNRYAMVVKNETDKPPAKNLFLTFAPSLRGPWTKPGPSISGEDWAEGATPIRINDAWYVYFDKYRDKRYGAVRSKNLQRWEDISDRVRFPAGVRHGTAFRAPEKVAAGIPGFSVVP